MKRSPEEDMPATPEAPASKKRKLEGKGNDAVGEETETIGDVRERDEGDGEPGFRLDEDLLFEVLKHVDARSLATAACVSKQWHRTAQDERLWELVCTRHWANAGCVNQQLRSVVLALGGFRRLHTHGLWPFLKPPAAPPLPASSAALAAPLMPLNSSAQWGKDEVHLSLSLLSIRYYEKMDLSKRGR